MNTSTIKSEGFSKYLLNCFWLAVPPLAINLLWFNRLPAMFQTQNFWKDIPPILAYGENITRIAVFSLAFFMPLVGSTKPRRLGIVTYLVGVLVYFLSWVLLVYFPQSAWSTSLVGSTAAAWTSLFWLVGIGLIGHSYYLPITYRPWVYVMLSVIFAVFHTFHAVMVYLRMN